MSQLGFEKQRPLANLSDRMEFVSKKVSYHFLLFEIAKDKLETVFSLLMAAVLSFLF